MVKCFWTLKIASFKINEPCPMSGAVFVIKSETTGLNLENKFLVEEIRILENTGAQESLKLLCKGPSGHFTMCTLVPGLLESTKYDALIDMSSQANICASSGMIELKGRYVQESSVGKDVLIISSFYGKTLRPNEKCVMKEGFNVGFFAATLEDSCSARTSVIFEIHGKDMTMCTLSHGRCSNGFFRYTYRYGESLEIHVIGPGTVSLVGHRM